MEVKEALNFVLKVFLDVFIVGVLFEALVLGMEQPVDVVLVVLARPLSVHLLVVEEEVWVDAAKEPLLLGQSLLHEHK